MELWVAVSSAHLEEGIEHLAAVDQPQCDTGSRITYTAAEM